MTIRPTVPGLLSFNGGYVDTMGFLALHGLFTTHVTGNFVTLGAALVMGATGVLAKVLALPLFCVVVALVRLLSGALEAKGLPALRTLFAIQFAMLSLAAAAAMRLGPFPDGDAPSALFVGGCLVIAMAIQNAGHRIHLASAPPTTIMTGTTTQIMIDLTDLLRSQPADRRAATRARFGKLSAAVAAFAFGCACGALFYGFGGMWSFLAPPALALAVLALHVAAPGDLPR